jgi:hypothetical protein
MEHAGSFSLRSAQGRSECVLILPNQHRGTIGTKDRATNMHIRQTCGRHPHVEDHETELMGFIRVQRIRYPIASGSNCSAACQKASNPT